MLCLTHLWVLREGFPEEGLQKILKEGARGGVGCSLQRGGVPATRELSNVWARGARACGSAWLCL